MSRKALRDFYRLQQQQGEASPASGSEASPGATPSRPSSPELAVPQPNLEGDLLELVATRRQIIAQERQLESEQKALIYNNYKKLIKASQRLGQIDSDLEVPKLTADLERLAGQLAGARRPLKSQQLDFADLREKWQQTAN